MAQQTIIFQYLSKNAKLPVRSTALAAGLDIFAPTDIRLLPKSRSKINVQIAVELPAGSFGKLESRSSLALQGIDVVASIIDADYRGPIFVVLWNTNSCYFDIKKGERIAQLIVQPLIYASPIFATTLNVTERQYGAFGSTGH